LVSIDTFSKLALTFPETEELPHFDKRSFRVRKKIFATLSEKDQKVCLKLSLIDQSTFCSIDRKSIYPVPNKWGKRGATFIELKTVKKEMLSDALTTAYCEVAPKQLSQPYRDKFSAIG
jgi:hypothetical protein